MKPERMPFFLARAREWRAVADELRACLPEWAPVLTVWREAAWCDLLLTKGRYEAIVKRLRVVFRNVMGANPPGSVSRPRNEADVLIVAADLFARMKFAVFARSMAG